MYISCLILFSQTVEHSQVLLVGFVVNKLVFLPVGRQQFKRLHLKRCNVQRSLETCKLLFLLCSRNLLKKAAQSSSHSGIANLNDS